MLTAALLPAAAAEAAPPANDDFVDAAPATIGLVDAQSTIEATTEPGEPQPCGEIGSTVWYGLTVDAPEVVTVSTAGSDFDTVVAVYRGGTTFGELWWVGCNDDHGGLQSQVGFFAIPGEVYWIQAGGYFGQTGSLEMAITGEPPPAGADLAIASYIAHDSLVSGALEVEVVNQGTTPGVGDLIVEACPRDLGDCRAVGPTRVALDPGAITREQLSWSELGFVGDYVVHAVVVPCQFDTDHSNNEISFSDHSVVRGPGIGTGAFSSYRGCADGGEY